MAGKRSAKVIFPLGGAWRRGTYAQKTQPFTTPRAINVRPFGPLERRGRGGSRPGLAKFVNNDFGTTITGISSVTYVDGDGNHKHDLAVICDGTFYVVSGGVVTTAKANLIDESGKYITDESGNYIIFTSTVSSSNPLGDATAFSMAEKGGKLYIGDSSLKKWDPNKGTVAVVPGAPTSQPLVCIYQERVILAGEDHMYYASAQDDDEDWDFAADMGNPGRAFAGHIGDGGKIGDVAKCMIPFRDRALVLGATDSLHVVYGNPTGGDGRAECVSEHIGIIAPGAATITARGVLFFMSRRGLFSWRIGSNEEPQPVSPERVPEQLLATDTSTTDVVLAYDHRYNGVHIFLTPSGTGTHWWLDLDKMGFWEVSLPATMQPYCAGLLKTAGDSGVLLGCKDGYVRRFSKSATNDDGTNITSNILFGPFHVPRMEGADGMIAEMVGAMGAGSGAVTWTLVVGNSAETVVDNAEDDLDNGTTTYVDQTGAWAAGQNAVAYPRSRGAWAILRLSATALWSYEAVSMWMKKLGRLR